MPKYFQRVLNLSEPLFSHGLERLEKATGGSGIDVRLIADITLKAHAIMRKLKLDIKDTTAHELYYALNSLVKNGGGEEILEDTDYVLLVIDDLVISFNLIDVIENLHHELPLTRHMVGHGQRSLCGELVGRYLEHARTNEQTTIEIAKMAGLLPESVTCYTKLKHKHNESGKVPKELLA